MSFFVVIAICLSFIVPLVVAAVGCTSVSTKIGALFSLAIVLALFWLITVLVLGDLSAHANASLWLSTATLACVFSIAYLLVAFAAFRRKLR